MTNEEPELEGDDLVDLTDQASRAGETFFEVLANDVQAVPNRVSHDRLGWDFHLQLPRSNDWRVSFTLDARPREPSCFVQVKATVQSIRSWRVKLSVWERLVKEPRPVFFLVFVFRRDDFTRPVEAFLVHVGEELLGQTLRELRCVDIDKADTLHERKLSFRWSTEDRLADLTGRELRARILAHIGDDLDAYEERKQQLVRTLGYDECPARATFRVSASCDDELYSKLADFAFGVSQTMEVEIVEASDVRFGVERPIPLEFQAEPAILKSHEPDVTGEIIFFGQSRGLRAQLPCGLHVGGPFREFLPEQHRRTRFVFAGGEIVLRREGVQMRVSVTMSIPVDRQALALSEAARIARACRAILDPVGVEVSTEVRGERIPFPRALTVPRQDGVDHLAAILVGAAEVARHVGLDPDMEIEPPEILRQEQFALFAGGKPVVARVEVQAELQGVGREPGVAVFLRRFDLARYRVHAFISVAGPATIDGRTVAVTGTPEVLSYGVTSVGEPPPDLAKLDERAMTVLRQRDLIALETKRLTS